MYLSIINMKIKIDISKKDKNLFFISDTHWFHNNVIIHDKRPFLFDKKLGYPEKGSKDKSNLNVELMNKTLIENWNRIVTKDDIVFHLGDFSWRGVQAAKEIADKLNGTIHFIMGNHDEYKVIKGTERFESINDYVELTVQYGADNKKDKVMLCLMHYPIISWNRKYHSSIMIHGHSHGNLMKDNPELYENNKIMDVGCCLIDYEPISFHEIMKIMDAKEMNDL